MGEKINIENTSPKIARNDPPTKDPGSRLHYKTPDKRSEHVYVSNTELSRRELREFRTICRNTDMSLAEKSRLLPSMIEVCSDQAMPYVLDEIDELCRASHGCDVKEITSAVANRLDFTQDTMDSSLGLQGLPKRRTQLHEDWVAEHLGFDPEDAVTWPWDRFYRRVMAPYISGDPTMREFEENIYGLIKAKQKMGPVKFSVSQRCSVC